MPSQNRLSDFLLRILKNDWTLEEQAGEDCDNTFYWNWNIQVTWGEFNYSVAVSVKAQSGLPKDVISQKSVASLKLFNKWLKSVPMWLKVWVMDMSTATCCILKWTADWKGDATGSW